MFLDKDMQKRRGKFISSPEALPQVLEILTSLGCIIVKSEFYHERDLCNIYCLHKDFSEVCYGCCCPEYTIESIVDENYIPRQVNRIRLK